MTKDEQLGFLKSMYDDSVRKRLTAEINHRAASSMLMSGTDKHGKLVGIKNESVQLIQAMDIQIRVIERIIEEVRTETLKI